MSKNKKIFCLAVLVATIIVAFLIIRVNAPKTISEQLPSGPISATEIKDMCIVEGGKKYNTECKNKNITLTNLYLYPLQENEQLLGHFYLYTSNLFKTKLTAINGDLLLVRGSYISVRAKKDAALLQKIEEEAKIIPKPIPVNVEGIIQIDQLCAGECYYGLFIQLKDIFFLSNF